MAEGLLVGIVTVLGTHRADAPNLATILAASGVAVVGAILEAMVAVKRIDPDGAGAQAGGIAIAAWRVVQLAGRRQFLFEDEGAAQTRPGPEDGMDQEGF